jgi:NADP-dependent aldehyde dehydrogenase
MTAQPILIAGQWRFATSAGLFSAENPATREPLPEVYPVSAWADCDAALAAAVRAAAALARTPADTIGRFLERFAYKIEVQTPALVDMAHKETGLPVTPRLQEVELPRTVNQLRLAAAVAREGSWQHATIDTKANIRSRYAPIGPVCVFGPNNFPFAFNSIAGGDFAAAIAAGNPVIAKANTSHPGTTQIFAQLAQKCADDVGMPTGSVQLLYRLSHEDGERLVSDPRVGATGYTGSRAAGLKLKAAADRHGKPIYLELSSINPVVILPGALAERSEQIAGEFATSCLMGAGQFCTNPGLVILLAGPQTEAFLGQIAQKFQAAPVGTLLSSGVQKSLVAGVDHLKSAGASLLVGGTPGGGQGYCYANTLLRVSGEQFLHHPHKLQGEAFGNASLVVVAADPQQAAAVLEQLEGNLTGCIYSDTAGSDDRLYQDLAPKLRMRVGRLLNDKMPTGVAVSPAMNHGGPYPATGHPGFTAVGLPASLVRFSVLECYDNVRPGRLPAALQDANPNGKMWRLIDGVWTQADVTPPAS